MYITGKDGRKFHVPDDKEAKRIRKGIEADPNTEELTDEQLAQLRPLSEVRRAGRSKAAATKQPISIRLSPEVIEHFKAAGKGWQTRIDEVLKSYVDAHR